MSKTARLRNRLSRSTEPLGSFQLFGSCKRRSKPGGQLEKTLGVLAAVDYRFIHRAMQSA